MTAQNPMKEKKTETVHTPIALYRKYRPKSFDDVLGQDHIVKVLEGAIKLQNISHAYLFAGSRGTGKTSIARIFAEKVGATGNDLYEIDAASNRGIDDVREIRESVQTLPFESKYKVYIIDEAHMLTKEAWNAFLKTLEEPPSYVIFILATTEIEKIPETVLSRCQTFQFKKPTLAVLKDVVLRITKEEERVLEPSSAELIALLGDGSFRDTEGILDKVLSFSAEKKISQEEVALITGSPRVGLVNNFVEALSQKNLATTLKTLEDAVAENISVPMFLKLVLQKMRSVLLLKYGGEALSAMVEKSVSEDDFKFLSELSNTKESGVTSQTLSRLLLAYDTSLRVFSPELAIELALIDIFQDK